MNCNLDFLSGQALRGNVTVVLNVPTAGQRTFTATISAQQAESTLANNTLTLTDGSSTIDDADDDDTHEHAGGHPDRAERQPEREEPVEDGQDAADVTCGCDGPRGRG